MLEKDKEHIKEEMADNIHIIWQFAELYGIDSTEILDEIRNKNARTLRRMEENK